MYSYPEPDPARTRPLSEIEAPDPPSLLVLDPTLSTSAIPAEPDYNAATIEDTFRLRKARREEGSGEDAWQSADQGAPTTRISPQA